MKTILKNIKKIQGKNRGEMSFGVQILLFILAVFIIWVLMGGNQKPIEDERIFVPITPTQ
ncbi:MAG: hypothetical protein EOM84_01775 [Sphingobacteriia bacterium]|nr:hypothetical protein [Sphingobacteriia bacterium]